MNVFSLSKLLLQAKTDEKQAKPVEAQVEKSKAKDVEASKTMEGETESCQTCGGLTDFRNHFKSDWHRYNVRQRLKNSQVVSQDEFEELDEISSIEASDDEDDVELVKGSPRIRFVCEQVEFSVYKVLLLPVSQIKHLPPSSPLWIQSLQSLQNSSQNLCMMMLGAGHFAAAVFDRSGKIIVSKTFHRYTTRRKQGGAQSSNDSAKGKAKSVGAQLRRANEAALEQEIQELLISWKKYLSECSHLFIRVSNNNRSAIYFDENVISASDPRIRTFTFTTKRPSLAELQRSFVELTCISVTDVQMTPELPKVETLAVVEKPLPVKVQEVKEVIPQKETIADLPKDLQRIIEFCRNAKSDSVKTFLSDPEHDHLVHSLFPEHLGTSLLHIASSVGSAETISILLEFGANPGLRIKNARPYDVASTKPARDAFRRYQALHPDQWDYTDAHVPGPLTDELESKQKEKDKLRRKKEKERKKTNTKREPSPPPPPTIVKPTKGLHLSNLERQAMGMSPEQRALLDREKRALAAEARMLALSSKCSACSKSLVGLIPFEKSAFKYCSMDCLKTQSILF